MGLLICSHSAFGQIPPSEQQRIFQPIIINGQQQEQGVMVVQNGTVQTHTCPYPQQYVTADRSSSGWACFEETTGMWLLHAQPPENTAPRAPTIVYSQPTPVYVPAPTTPIYSYPYSYFAYGYPYSSYYPYYSYPFFVGPQFGFGFGFRSPIFINRPFVINRP